MELDHLYRETVHWEDSVAFWSVLGFDFVEQWGSKPHRAGRLVNGGASVVLAEVDDKDTPSSSTFLSTPSIETLAIATHTPVVDTHWGTRMVTLTDPDGRTYNFEPRSETP